MHTSKQESYKPIYLINYMYKELLGTYLQGIKYERPGTVQHVTMDIYYL